MSKRNISAEICVLYCKLDQFQKIREINVCHLCQGLDQSTKGFLMFAVDLIFSFRPNSHKKSWMVSIIYMSPNHYYFVNSWRIKYYEINDQDCLLKRNISVNGLTENRKIFHNLWNCCTQLIEWRICFPNFGKSEIDMFKSM